MIGLIFFILAITYVISIFVLIEVYIRKNIDPCFWSISALITPILNTILCIRYGNFFEHGITDSFYKFIKDLQK